MWKLQRDLHKSIHDELHSTLLPSVVRRISVQWVKRAYVLYSLNAITRYIVKLLITSTNIITSINEKFTETIPNKNSPLCLMLHGFYPARVRKVSGVENIGQCGRLSQLSWFWAHFNILTYLLTYLITSALQQFFGNILDGNIRCRG